MKFSFLCLVCVLLLWAGADSASAQTATDFSPTVHSFVKRPAVLEVSPAAGSLPSPSNKWQKPLTFVYFGCGAADTVTTEIALRRPGYVELNPVLGDSRARRVAVSWSVRGAAYIVFRRVGRKHPRLANVGLALGAGVGCAAAVANARR